MPACRGAATAVAAVSGLPPYPTPAFCARASAARPRAEGGAAPPSTGLLLWQGGVGGKPQPRCLRRNLPADAVDATALAGRATQPRESHWRTTAATMSFP